MRDTIRMALATFVAANARWLSGGFVCALASSYGQTFFIALSGGAIRDSFAISHGEFGALYAAATLLGAVIVIPIGGLADHVPAKRYGVFVLAGLVVSMVAFSIAASLTTLFVALAGLRLFGQGLCTHTAMTVTGKWFSRERGRALSIVALGHQFGESVMPVTFVLLAGWVGWRVGWQINAVIAALVFLPMVHAAFARDRNPDPPLPADARPAIGRTRAEALADPVFWLLLVAVPLPLFFGTVVFFHQVHLMEIRGEPLALFAGSTPLLSLTAIATTLASGWVIDRIGSLLTIVPMLVVLAAANLLLGHYSSVLAVPAYLALMGGAFGFYSTTIGAIWPELYGTAHLGAIKGVVTGAKLTGAALGPAASGFLIDRGVIFGSMVSAMGIASIVAACAVSAVLISRPRGVRA